MPPLSLGLICMGEGQETCPGEEQPSMTMVSTLLLTITLALEAPGAPAQVASQRK